MTKPFLCLLLVVACASPRPDTIYRPRLHGSIDLNTNLNAKHCSELTGDFRDAYGLADSVQNILSIAIAADASRVVLQTERAQVPSSRVIGDPVRLSAFWYYDDWTLAVVLDRHDCPGGLCPAEISLIKYNGARSPIERPSKLCFERWVGAFEPQRGVAP